MRKLYLIAATAAALIVAGQVARADEAPTQTPATDSDPNAIVCKSMAPETGTRIGSRRICQTQKAWDDQRQEAEKDLQKAQVPGTLNTGSGGN